MGPGFDGYHEEDLSLLPFNAHFSKFGNRLIAKRLAEILQKHVDYRLRNSLDSKAANFGDLPPALNEIWDEASEAPYRVKTNQYGFRMNEDFQLDTPKQKILVLGDSITFGPYLANHDTYTDMLGRMMPHAIIMNAGISGYSIPDQWSLFQEKAKFANPDIVVLQVFHNDLTDLFYFKRNEFDRLGRVHEPTLIEIEFLETVHKLRSATPGTRRSGDLN